MKSYIEPKAEDVGEQSEVAQEGTTPWPPFSRGTTERSEAVHEVTARSHIHDLDFISDRLKAVFAQNAGTDASSIPVREIIDFRRQLRTWDKGFSRPPDLLLFNCRLDDIQSFYSRRIDFSIFNGFSRKDQKIIREEIAAYAAREAMDSFYGYRLRNRASIGIISPKWHVYLSKVRGYYDKVMPQKRKERIARFLNELSSLAAEKTDEIAAKCMGELFFDVDRIRLMSSKRLESYLDEIRKEVLKPRRRREKMRVITPPPEMIRDAFEYMGLSYPVELYELKSRYRELARTYHPDKGGSSEEMQQLNTAYRIAVRYILKP
ncbi:MAG: J domain-containing protein [Candidatus Poribacteria bacterium]